GRASHFQLSTFNFQFSTPPSFRPEHAKNERAERRDLPQNARRYKAASAVRSSFLDSATLRSE
ncbi:MAG: hypothetical protein LBF81_01685, partial [Prevotellaceae bacterium]|nr:hypothetical protein [Prevotellaceae bacterium]